MIKKTAGIFTVTLLMLAFAVDAAAQLRIGYMNPNEVLSQIPERESIEQELNDLVEKKREELQQRTANFQEQLAEYQENKASMSQEQQKKREQQLSNMEQELIKYQQNLQLEIQQRRSELLQPLYSRMDAAIAEVSEQMNLDFVLNQATGYGENIIYYAGMKNMNITEQVLNRMKNDSQ
ncbi:MAG: OmpH family outer membrane protein [Balneolaceae bacterium]|nr:OmpH family outer membrane protein [Balneolaceae bacterium]